MDPFLFICTVDQKVLFELCGRGGLEFFWFWFFLNTSGNLLTSLGALACG